MTKIAFFLFFSLTCFAKGFAKGAVYCLHGFLRSSWSMEAIATDLKMRKYRVTNWNYPSRSKTIDEHAKALVRHLQTTAEKFSGRADPFCHTFDGWSCCAPSDQYAGLPPRGALGKGSPYCPSKSRLYLCPYAS